MQEITPSDTRYVPFTQQPYCCVPACLSMVMYRHGIPLIPQEQIGYELGLTVPDEDAPLFFNVRTGQKPIAGWGTQIEKEEFSPNAAFTRLGIPLQMNVRLIDTFTSSGALLSYLKEQSDQDNDVLICYSYGALFDTDSRNGHVNVFDKVNTASRTVRLIDPAWRVPKWREVSVDKLYDAMKVHGAAKSGGAWELEIVR